LRLNAPDHAADVEELGCAAEERFLVDIEAKPFVAEELAEVEKVTGAAPEIENMQWWGTIEPKILRAPNVHADPVFCIFVRIDLPRIWPVGIALAQSL
jgi:hypothetical protein